MDARLLAFAATTLLLALPSSALGGTNDPVPLGPLGGSAIEIAIDPLDTDRMLVIQYLQGFVLSTDGGVSFDPFPTSLSPSADELVQDPIDGQILYAIDGKQIFRSPDFGLNWSALALVANENLKNIALAPSGSTMLAVDAFNVYRSTDTGASWSTVASVVPFGGTVLDDAIFAPSDGSRAYYSFNDGIRASTDGGQTWSDPGGTTLWVQAVTVDPTDPDTVFIGTPFNGVLRSQDAGANFVDVTDPVVAGNSEFFAWEPDGSRLWYAQLQGLGYTSDLGATWTDATAGLFPSLRPIPAVLGFDGAGKSFLGAESNFITGTAGGGLYDMESGETDWTHIGFFAGAVRAAVVPPSGLRVTGMGAGVFAGPSGQELVGTAWTSDTRAIAVDPTNPNRWVVGGVGVFIDNAQIATMMGSGLVASLRYEVFGAGSTQDIEFDPGNPNRVLAGFFPAAFGQEAIVLSNDAGFSWMDVPGTAGWATRDIAFDPHTPGRVLQLSDNSQWAESPNGGAAWGLLQPAWSATGPAVLLAFDPFVAGRLYRGETGGGLWRSTDDGATWTPLGVPLVAGAEIVFDPSALGVFWIGDASGNLLLTGDGGDTFTIVGSVPTGDGVTSLALDPSSGSLLIGTDDAAAWELLDATPFPLVYCVAKTSTAGCEAAVATSDPNQPVSGAGGYEVTASGVQNNKSGLVFASISGPAVIPFSGGTLCMGVPLKRGPIMTSRGNPPPDDCSGSYATVVNDGSVIPAGLDAGPGNSATYQYWYRDPAGGAGNLGTALSNAVQLDFQ